MGSDAAAVLLVLLPLMMVVDAYERYTVYQYSPDFMDGIGACWTGWNAEEIYHFNAVSIGIVYTLRKI